LVDENLSPLLASLLVDAGHDADHVARVGLGASDDATLLEFADSTKAVIISADTDFSALLAHVSIGCAVSSARGSTARATSTLNPRQP
jgi:predicted nuclease of predicted toxin-antitoxin system